MKQFISKEQLEVICGKEGKAWDEVQQLAEEEFILVMLRMD